LIRNIIYASTKLEKDKNKNNNLIGVRKAAHTGHDTENIVVGRVDADLGGVGTADSRIGKDELKGGIVNAREIAGARWLVLLGPEREGVDVDTSIGIASVVLVGLDKVEVGTLTLREAILSVKLELSGDNGILAPAVHVEGGLGENEGAGVRDGRAECIRLRATLGSNMGSSVLPLGDSSDIISTRILKEARAIDELVGTLSRGRTTEGVDRVGKRVNRVGVIEGLGTEHVEENGVAKERGTVVNVSIRLNNPDKLLARVIEVELDLVGRGTNRLITSELELFDKVLVGVLRHASALVGVKEDIVDIERSSNKRLLVSSGDLNAAELLLGPDSRIAALGHVVDRPEALINGTKI